MEGKQRYDGRKGGSGKEVTNEVRRGGRKRKRRVQAGVKLASLTVCFVLCFSYCFILRASAVSQIRLSRLSLAQDDDMSLTFSLLV